MHRQSPKRGHGSKGIKVKHILQICLLLAICFWLVYQVKHSQEKRKELNGKDVTVVDKLQTESEVLRFGRKDLPRVTEIATEEKHVEDEEGNEAEEESEKPEVEDVKPEEDENKHEEEESEGDGKIEEREEERGGGDDEIDENDPDKREAEHEQGEEQADEDKDREDNDGDAEQSHTEGEENEDAGKENHDEGEENEDAGREGRSELEESHDADTENHDGKDMASNGQDHDEDSAGTHEAREELYKADDASSEVAHNVRTVNPETQNVTMDHANDMFGKMNFGQENETTTSVRADAEIKTEDQPLVAKDGVSNGTVIEQKIPDNDLTRSDEGSLQKSTSATLLNNLPELHSDTTSLTNLSENASVVETTGHQDSGVLGTVSLSSDEKTQSEDSFNSNNKTENAYTNAGDTSVDDEIEGEKSENDGTVGLDETSSSHLDDENASVVEHDPIDVSDISITDEEKESRMDLDTLPKTETEGQNTEEATAE